MALRDAIRRLFGRDIKVRVASVSASVLGMGPEELYRTQPALRAVISFLADNAAHLPLKCYVRESDTSRPRDTESALARFAARPSAAMTEHELIRATASDYYLHGWALWCVLPSPGMPSGWSAVHIPVAWVESTETVDGFEPSGYAVVNPRTGGRVVLDAADCLRFYSYDPLGPLFPASPVDALKQVLSEQISAWNFRNGVWRNGGRVSQYLYRPRDTPWGDGARDRFARSWKSRFAGEGGTDTGGTPLLEDGMELRAVTFNAKEAEWAEATQLTREDVAAIYHVNPAMVWHSGTQTYASAKDNARSLYADAMGPFLNMVEERINAFLVPRFGLDASHYIEFDLDAKLQGDFESRASVMQSSTGAPWLTRNEARAWMNLPAVEGGDELIVPMNVVDGGLASPNDTDPTRERYNGAAAARKADVGTARKDQSRKGGLEPDPSSEDEDADADPQIIRFKSEPNSSGQRAAESIISGFLERQAKSVANRIAAMEVDQEKKARRSWDSGIELPSWWQGERWDSELAADLADQSRSQAVAAARAAFRRLGLDPDDLDEDAVRERAERIAGRAAIQVNRSTLARIAGLLARMESEGATHAEASEAVGEMLERRRASDAERTAATFATQAANYGTFEGARQSGYECTKTWIALPGSRMSHARMNGQRVKLDSTFSNGAMWPGDPDLPPEETCNCRCRMEIASAGGRRRAGGGMDDLQRRSASAMRDEIARARGVGPEEGMGAADYLGISYCTPRMVGVIEEAVGYLPTDWLRDARAAGVRVVGVFDQEGRSRYLPGENVVLMDVGADFLEVAHELVHAREEHSPRFLAVERRFFDLRTAGHEKKALVELDPTGLYEKDEMAYDVLGRSAYAYLYRDYGDEGGGRRGFEVGAFGVECLYRGSEAFRRADKAAYAFVNKLIREG